MFDEQEPQEAMSHSTEVGGTELGVQLLSYCTKNLCFVPSFDSWKTSLLLLSEERERAIKSETILTPEKQTFSLEARLRIT